MKVETMSEGLFTFKVSETKKTEVWNEIFKQAQRQSLLGVMWPVVKDCKMPLDIAFQWVGITESIRGMNILQYKEATRLTKMFEMAGRRSVILKGQANARLYPDKLLRQPGDIDIWVEGGRESVLDLLVKLGLLKGRPSMAYLGNKGDATLSYHHVHLPVNNEGVEVEVHFRPSKKDWNPMTNRKLQDWLEMELMSSKKVEEGFYVPSITFSLVMQLSHIQWHFFDSGVGLRQICDYYWLLRNSTEEERKMVSGMLGQYGLKRTAGALMWILGETLHLDEGLMLCEKDEWRGNWMLREVMNGGNFGLYAEKRQSGMWCRFWDRKIRQVKLMRFHFGEQVWAELDYWIIFVKTIPERVRRRRLSLRD